MKKFCLIIAAFAAVLAVSCTKEEKDEPRNDKYKFYELCLDWGASKQGVEAFVARMDGWQGQGSILGDENEIFFLNPNNGAQMIYTFKEGGLEEASINYDCGEENFAAMKSDVSRKYGISDWESNPVILGVTWFDSTIKSKSCSVMVGWCDDALVTYMFTTYMHSTIL